MHVIGTKHLPVNTTGRASGVRMPAFEAGPVNRLAALALAPHQVAKAAS